MEVLTKTNKKIFLSSVTLIALGYLIMKLEPAPHGYGPWALTVAPLLIISGFVLAFFSIFHGKQAIRGWKDRRLFMASGWILFMVSFIVYMLTLEETASLWDCSEFIACAYKLQVPHAPGAPLFLMIGRLFSLLSFGDPMKVAFWINVNSALSSAGTVMFTFWSLIMLVRRIKTNASDFSLTITGVVGGLVIAFSDSFWFSAVEAETYAMATLFLAICFWAILKWSRERNDIIHHKWLILIFYLLGLSIGVHPMSLLILPALAIIIAFKDHNFSWKRLLFSTTTGAAGILFLNHAVLFGLPDAMKNFDIFFVNSLCMPFYFGALAFIVILFSCGFMIYRWSVRNRKPAISIFLVGMMYFLVGYSSYFMIIIRSQANPSIDENNPEDLMTLTSYLKRESYGTRPFLYGPGFAAKIKSYKQGVPVYTKSKDRYEITDYRIEYTYDKADQTIFPRMYSNRQDHINTYREWTGLKAGEQPKFKDHLPFMFRYQFGHMYFRYLMFNFSGRQSDIQHAEWLSPLDIMEDVPAVINENKARNNFLMLPFLLGIVGMYYQFKKDKVGFWSVMAYFLFLGLVLVFYLNSTPNEPRERDYIYVGSYLAFAMWCGVGAMGIHQFLNKKLKSSPLTKSSTALMILVPLLMLTVGYDDHNRTGRTLHIDHARNTLAGCAPNAILFTGGDNDTFPLWYVQEVEGFRTDVRVIVLSYFNTDWYIDQMRRKAYESEPLPFSLDKKHYQQGGLNDILPFIEQPKIKGPVNLYMFMELIKQEHRALQVTMGGGTKYNSIPSKSFFMKIDKEKLIDLGVIPSVFYKNIPEKLEISWNGNYLEKNALMVLDLIATNQWERPIYFNVTSLNTISLNLKKHVLQEGLIYRLHPIQLDQEGAIDTEKMYTNLMEKYQFNDLDNEKVYYTHEDYQLRILQSIKTAYSGLAQTLYEQNQFVKASKVIDFISSELLTNNINLDISTVSTIGLLFRAGKSDQANQLANRMFYQADSILNFLDKKKDIGSTEGQIQLFIVNQLYVLSEKYGYFKLADKCRDKLALYNIF